MPAEPRQWKMLRLRLEKIERLKKNTGYKQINRLKLGVKTEEKKVKVKNILLPWKLLVLHIDKGLTAFPF